MHIKKFEAFEMSQALRTIKAEMGPDAVILSTREIKEGGSGLLNCPIIEVTAAVDVLPPAKEPPNTRSAPRPPAGGSSQSGPDGFQRYLEEAARLENHEGPSLREELRAIKSSLDQMRSSIPLLRASGGTGQTGLPPIHETWLEMKVMLRAMTEAQYQKELSGAHQTLVALFNQLVSNGVDSETAMTLFKAMKQKLSQDDLWKEDFVRDYLKQMIKGMVKVAGPVAVAGDLPKVVALVGPTGAGKTTTIAKLAARQCRENGKVTLVTLDTDRVGGVEQLKSYGKAIGASVVALRSGNELNEVVARQGKGGLVLIDTAGRSHLHPQQVLELKKLGSAGVSLETHLALSANTKEGDLDDMIDRFSVIPIDCFIFTKIDETRTYGPLLAATRRKGKPISYLTMGQRVPEDIEVAAPKRIAELVLS